MFFFDERRIILIYSLDKKRFDIVTLLFILAKIPVRCNGRKKKLSNLYLYLYYLYIYIITKR